MTVSIISGAEGAIAVAGSVGSHEWIIGYTPFTEMLRVDCNEFRALLQGAKYSNHRSSDPCKGIRPPDDLTRITMLVAGGPWEQRMWHEQSGLDVTYRLNSPGDYVAWCPGPFHQWRPIGDATMLTINFRRIGPNHSVKCSNCNSPNEFVLRQDLPDGWYGQVCTSCVRPIFINLIAGSAVDVRKAFPET